MDQSYYGLKRQDIKRMSFQLAIRSGFKHPLNQEDSEAGKKQFRSFLPKHPVISMRTPEGTSAARMKGFISENVARSFDIYESELRKVNYPVHKIFNADATRITAVQHRHSNVVSKGQERSGLSNIGSVVICIYATGTYEGSPKRYRTFFFNLLLYLQLNQTYPLQSTPLYC